MTKETNDDFDMFLVRQIRLLSHRSFCLIPNRDFFTILRVLYGLVSDGLQYLFSKPKFRRISRFPVNMKSWELDGKRYFEKMLDWSPVIFYFSVNLVRNRVILNKGGLIQFDVWRLTFGHLYMVHTIYLCTFIISIRDCWIVWNIVFTWQSSAYGSAVVVQALPDTFQ